MILSVGFALCCIQISRTAVHGSCAHVVHRRTETPRKRLCRLRGVGYGFGEIGASRRALAVGVGKQPSAALLTPPVFQVRTADPIRRPSAASCCFQRALVAVPLNGFWRPSGDPSGLLHGERYLLC